MSVCFFKQVSQGGCRVTIFCGKESQWEEGELLNTEDKRIRGWRQNKWKHMRGNTQTLDISKTAAMIARKIESAQPLLAPATIRFISTEYTLWVY